MPQHSMCVHYVIHCTVAGVYVSLTSVVLVDLLGLEKLTSSFGLVLLFQGIGAILGPPIAGTLYCSLYGLTLALHPEHD